MLLFILLSVMTCLLSVTCRIDHQCSLKVINERDYSWKIVDYIQVDSTIEVIQYNLTIYSNGTVADWNNISDTFSIEPWNWYRTMGDNVIEFLLKVKNILLAKYFLPELFLYIQVDLYDVPSGCLQNIKKKEMSSFILNGLLDDFQIHFVDLRTSAKRYQDAALCTRRKDEIDKVPYQRCCKYDGHNDLICERFQENTCFVITTYVIVAFLSWLTFVFGPYLFCADKKSRIITIYVFEESCIKDSYFNKESKKSSNSNDEETEIYDYSKGVSSKTMSINDSSSITDLTKDDCIKSDSTKVYFSKTDLTKDDCIKTDSTKVYFSKTDLTKDDCIKSDKTKVYFSKTDLTKDDCSKTDSTKDDCSKTDFIKDDSKKNDYVKTVQIDMNSFFQKDQPLPFGLIHSLKSIVSFCVKSCCKCKKCKSCKAKCHEKVKSCCKCEKCKCCKSKCHEKKCSFKNVFTRIFIVLFFFTLPCVALSIRYYFLGETTFIIITVVYSVFSFIIIPGVIVDDCCFHKLNSGFDEFSIRTCCERKYGWDIRFPPLIFIIASVAFQCKGKTTKCLCYFFFAAWAFLFTLPASALVFVFATLVAISIFEATYVKSLLAGLLAFLVYVREASNGIRKKHERCLRIITENILESISTTDVDKAERCLRFFTIKGNNPTRHEEGLLIAESCIPYIIVNEKILVKDTAISHILKVKIQKIITFLVLGAFFITSTILLVILFAKWDFISPSNQAFITFITGIIPLVFKIGYSGTSRDSDIFFDKDELEEKLKTYSEQFKKAKEEIQRRDSNGQEQTDLQPNAADSSISPGAGSDDVEEHFNVASETNDKSKKYNAIMADIERGLNISNPRNKDKFTYSFENSDERTPLNRFSV